MPFKKLVIATISKSAAISSLAAKHIVKIEVSSSLKVERYFNKQYDGQFVYNLLLYITIILYMIFVFKQIKCNMYI